VGGRLESLCESYQFDDAIRLGNEILESGAAPRLMGIAHCCLARSLLELRLETKALGHAREARHIFESLNDPWYIVEAMDWEASTLYLLEDPAALDIAQEALRRYRVLEPRRPSTEARLLRHIGNILCYRRQYEEAAKYLNEALRLPGTAHDLVWLAHVFDGLAMCEFELGDHIEGIRLGYRALNLYMIEQGVNPALARARLPQIQNNLAMMLLRMGRYETAEALLRSAAASMSSGDARLSMVLLSLGELYQRQGRLGEAHALVSEALGAMAGSGQKQSLVIALKQLAELEVLEGDLESARESFRCALRLAPQVGLRAMRGEILASYREALRGRRRLRGTGVGA
jgi:tetratricopeptide (TPR) repeat protein